MTIQIDHLHKSYGSGAEAHEVLHDINLTIDSGEVFGILGSSGAGKSTLVRCINLLERPTSGKCASMVRTSPTRKARSWRTCVPESA